MRVDRRTLFRAGAGAAVLATLAGTSFADEAKKIPWGDLATRIKGTLVTPSDAAYTTAKQAYYSQFDVINPQAVAYCVSAEDVAECVKFAKANYITATARSGGHSSAGYSTTTGLVVDVSRMNSATSISATSAVFGAGIQLVDATNALAPQGLAVPGGLHPTVGLAGYLQGGGFGFLTRSEGVGCDNLLGAEVVLASGEIVRASETTNADLFWALRGGGGGNFGIITRLKVKPVAITGLVNFSLTWAWEHAAKVVAGWQRWIVDGPRQLGAQFNIVMPDAAPGAVPLVSVSGAWSGDPTQAAAVVDALVSAVGKAPATRRVQALPFQDAMMEWYGCAGKSVAQCHRTGTTTEGVLARGNFLLTRTRMYSAAQPESAITAELAAFDANRRTGHTRVLSAAAFGGKANDVSRTATAYVHRDTQFSLIAATTLPVGSPSTADRDAAKTWVNGVFNALDPTSNHETYQNFVDPSLVSWRTAYYAENYNRLLTVKNHYDPGRFFKFAQSVGA